MANRALVSCPTTSCEYAATKLLRYILPNCRCYSQQLSHITSSTAGRAPAKLNTTRFTLPVKPIAKRQVSVYASSSLAQPSPSSSYGVVITGGSKGLGYAMAREFLLRGDKVLLCARNEQRLAAAVSALQKEYPKAQVYGMRADVAVAGDVEALAKAAAEKLGTVHFWINNAGQVTHNALLSEVSASEITSVVGVNVLGSLLGSREAIRLMRSQPPSPQPCYHIFNLGFSSWGASFSKSAVTHKMTKRALTQLSLSLAEELKAAGLSSIGVHNLSPGMVLTDLLLGSAGPASRRFFNTLAEEPETVAADLVPRIREVQGSGSSIEYLNPASAIGRVLSRVPQIINGGRFFDKEGERVPQGGQKYNPSGVRLLYDYSSDEY